MATENATQDAESGGNSIVAALLSMFIPGLGHYYAGQKGRATYWFAGVVVYFFLSLILMLVGIGLIMLLIEPIIHFIAGVDAYVQS